MEEKKKGGSRKGAGRKPVLHKKKQVSLYVEPIKFLPFGSEDKMKDHLYDVIDNFKQEAKVVDLNKPTNEIKPFEQPKTNYEAKVQPKPENIPLGSYEAFRIAILETTMTKPLEKIMREVKAALMANKQKQMLEAIAKDHSKDFFTD
jgi:hypothetical protein